MLEILSFFSNLSKKNDGYENTTNTKNTHICYISFNKDNSNLHHQILDKITKNSKEYYVMLNIIKNRNKDICCNPKCNKKIIKLNIVYKVFDSSYCCQECQLEIFNLLYFYWNNEV